MTEEKIEKAVFVGIIRQNDDERKVMEYLDELEFLAETAGATGDRKFVQRLDKPEKATYIKVSEKQNAETLKNCQNIAFSRLDYMFFLMYN